MRHRAQLAAWTQGCSQATAKKVPPQEKTLRLVTSQRPDVDLAKYGFFPHEDTLDTMRCKYVQLLDQYKRCAHLFSAASSGRTG